jgi:hypothetical protein
LSKAVLDRLHELRHDRRPSRLHRRRPAAASPPRGPHPVRAEQKLHMQGRPKSWGKLRPLIEILSRRAGPSRAIRAKLACEDHLLALSGLPRTPSIHCCLREQNSVQGWSSGGVANTQPGFDCAKTLFDSYITVRSRSDMLNANAVTDGRVTVERAAHGGRVTRRKPFFHTGWVCSSAGCLLLCLLRPMIHGPGRVSPNFAPGTNSFCRARGMDGPSSGLQHNMDSQSKCRASLLNLGQLCATHLRAGVLLAPPPGEKPARAALAPLLLLGT